MSLTDLMSSAGLTFWPIAGLLLFIFAFVLIGIRTFGRGSRSWQSEAARLPLEEAGDRDSLTAQSTKDAGGVQ